MGRDDSKFADAFSRVLKSHNMRAADAATTMEVSRSYVAAVARGDKKVGPERIDSMSQALGFSEKETLKLHRAAAIDAGFRLDLPDDF